MLNLSIISLNLVSISTSPLLSLPSCRRQIQFSICNSHISRSFTNIIYSSTINHQTCISNSCFHRTLRSSIRLVNENEEIKCFLDSKYNYQPNVPIGGHDFVDTHPYFTQNCGNITITGCQFIECSSSDDNGGAICIMQESYVTIHNTIFDKCSSQQQTGGACLIIKSKTASGIDFNDERTKDIDIQYCCYQNCFGSGSLYGVCIFSASEKTRLYYASSVNCPGQTSTQLQGAQFDLQSNEITSHDVNATGAHAYHCGGIEYRYATVGYFRFQTISYITAMFSVSYTDINTDNLKLENSNIHHVTLDYHQTGDGRDPLYSGLIHVRYANTHSTGSDINIENFCFVENTFSNEAKDQSRIISKGTSGGKVCEYKVVLEKCYYDVEHAKVAFNNVATNNCVENTNTLNEINQLDLGECKGKVTAAPLTPSPSFGFSESFDFTNSEKFSESFDFTNSEKFSESFDFTKSSHFSETSGFAQTDIFSDSNEFTKNEVYSKSNGFTNSNVFSDSFLIEEPLTGPDSKEKSKNKTGMIAGIVVGVVAAAVIIALVAFFLIKKKSNLIDEEDIETIDGSTNLINTQNPLYNTEAKDDPFKEDFENY